MREARGTTRKVALVAEHLARVPDDALPHAAVFWTGAPFAAADPRVPRVGWATLRDAALAVLPWDDVVWSASHRTVGDTGETLARLLEAAPLRAAPARQARLDAWPARPAATGPAAALTLADVAAAFDALARARDGATKRRVLEDAWRRMAPVEAKVFTKLLTGGMRIGLSAALVDEAVARASGRPPEAVREASMITGDVGRVALLARRDRLDEAVFQPFHPLQFMLASPIASAADMADDPLDRYAVEDKLDGVRAQLHKVGERVVLYTRALSVAAEFPEVEAAARRVPGSFVLDGEVVAWDAERGRVAPFGRLQRRLGRKEPDAALLAEIPVRFVAYDVVWRDGRALHREPFEARRRELEAIPLAEPLARSRTYRVEDVDALARAFEAARARGNEGLVLKRVDAPYEFGRRGRRWLKLKATFATLDVVVTAAEHGQGKRAGLLSDYTFAVRGPDGAFLNVGKAYIGVTDEEIRRLTRRLRALTTERFGSVHVVRPEVVLEVAFDSVQPSARHRSGYALRFPRVVRIRDDKLPQEADTLERVEELARLAAGEPSPATRDATA